MTSPGTARRISLRARGASWNWPEAVTADDSTNAPFQLSLSSGFVAEKRSSMLIQGSFTGLEKRLKTFDPSVRRNTPNPRFSNICLGSRSILPEESTAIQTRFWVKLSRLLPVAGTVNTGAGLETGYQ